MANKGLIGVQMSTIAPAKMPHFDAYESMGKLKWFDAESRKLADEVFDGTMSTMNEIASDYSVSFDEVLGSGRSVSRF